MIRVTLLEKISAVDYLTNLAVGIALPKPQISKLPPLHTTLRYKYTPPQQDVPSFYIYTNAYQFLILKRVKWLAPSRPLGSPREGRLRESSWPPRLLGSLRRPREEWRSPTGSGPERWRWGRSGSTRRALSFWSGSCRSRGWLGRLLRTLRRIWGFRAALWLLSRRRRRRTWLVSLRTPISAPFTPRESPSCPRTSSSLAESAARELRLVPL